MKTVIVGYGEIGKAFGKLMDRRGITYSTVDIDKEVIRDGDQHDIMLVNIPFSDKFHEQVVAYHKRFKPSLIIINSTVAVGTTKALNGAIEDGDVVHSPVRGIHPNLVGGLIAFTKQIGYDENKISAELTKDFFRKIGITNTSIVEGSKNTELAKLISTTTYGVQIAWATEVNKICEEFGCDYDTVYTDSNKIYNEGYELLQKPQYKKPLLKPNKGGIGGHCVVSNAIILAKALPLRKSLIDSIIDLSVDALVGDVKPDE